MPAGITADRHVAKRADRYTGGVTIYVVAIAVLAAAGGMMFGYVEGFGWWRRHILASLCPDLITPYSDTILECPVV